MFTDVVADTAGPLRLGPVLVLACGGVGMRSLVWGTSADVDVLVNANTEVVKSKLLMFDTSGADAIISMLGVSGVTWFMFSMVAALGMWLVSC